MGLVAKSVHGHDGVRAAGGRGNFPAAIEARSATVTRGSRDRHRSRIFAVREAIDKQLSRVRRERENNPSKTELTMRRGQLLVHCAREGLLRKVDQIVSQCPPEEMLTWFSVRMFKEACLHNRLHIISFMVNHGLDVEFHAVFEAVHWLVEGCGEERDGIDVVPSINFLVREAGMPPDSQRNRDFRTPLHLATERGLFEAARRLIELGADVNAVAKDDVMPLTLAENGSSDNEMGVENDDASPLAKATITKNGDRGTFTRVSLPPPPPPPTTATVTAEERSLGHSPQGHYCLPNPVDHEEELNGMRTSLKNEHEEALERTQTSGNSCPPPPSSSSSPSSGTPLLYHPKDRAMASRARICGLLLERGARRSWRRNASEAQAALDAKYAALLEEDDGRNFCTFNG